MTDERMLLTIPETCRQLAISRSTLYDLMGRGAIQPVRIGAAVRIPRVVLEGYINSLIGTPPRAA